MASEFTAQTVVSGDIDVAVQGIGESTATLHHEPLWRGGAIVYSVYKDGKVSMSRLEDFFELVSYDPKQHKAIFRVKTSASTQG